MPGIIEFPQVVQDALALYGDLFANECPVDMWDRHC